MIIRFRPQIALMGAALLALLGSYAAAGDAPRTTVGAIRWDAWSGGSVSKIMESTLGPRRYHHRLPWFAAVTGPDAVRIAGGTQEIMDQEIAFAADAGLDYWAFVMYARTDAMSVPLSRFLASTSPKRLGFSLLLHNNLNVSEAELPVEVKRAVDLLSHPRYQRLPDGRPLVYYFESRHWGAFMKAAQAAGHKPFLVCMNWNMGDFARLKNAGVGAMSAYAVAEYKPAYAALADKAERDWQKAANHAIPWVPLVTAGWDKRPRQDHPVPWEAKDANHTWPPTPTPTELADHLRRALDFVNRHPAISPARTVMIYAWNEYDEGGWITPTRGADGRPDDSRLKALAAVLRDGVKP